MIKLFCYIAKTLADMGLNPANYRIVIVPLSTDAESALMKSMSVDAKNLNWEAEAPLIFRAGYISGMPFRIDIAK